MADYKSFSGPRIKGEQFSHRESPVAHRDKRPVVNFEDAVDKVYAELAALLLSKHKDYGPKNIADAPGGALNGLRVRIHDKLARINNLVDTGDVPQYESLEDSFKDMANYAIIGLLVLRKQWDND
jgi:hypothetical protein